MPGPQPSHGGSRNASRTHRCLFFRVHRLLPVFPVLVADQQRDREPNVCRPHPKGSLPYRFDGHPAAAPIAALTPLSCSVIASKSRPVKHAFRMTTRPLPCDSRQ